MRWLSLLLLPVCLFGAADDDAAFFEKNIRPLFAAKCLACHSGAQQPMAGLALDSRERAIKGGGRGPAIVAGQPAASLLLKAVTRAEGVPKMPPSGNLKDDEVALLTEWIQRGAPWGMVSPVIRTASRSPKGCLNDRVACKEDFWLRQ